MSQSLLFVTCIVHCLLKTQALFAMILAHSLYTGAIEMVVFNGDNRVTAQKRHTHAVSKDNDLYTKQQLSIVQHHPIKSNNL